MSPPVNISLQSMGNLVSLPVMGLGTWQCTNEEARVAVSEALNIGYRHIDTAWLYGNEKGVGQGLADWIKQGGDRRDVIIVTKLPLNANRAEDVERLLDKQLSNLGLEYVDIYLVHGPPGIKNTGNDEEVFNFDENGCINYDYETDLISLWKGMERMVEKGKAKTIGVSNFNENQISRILESCQIKPVINQIEVHAYFCNAELIKYCKNHGIHICAYSPLGSPARGNIMKDTDPSVLLEDPLLREISKKYKKTGAQILLRHLVQKGLAVIPKSSNPKRMRENISIWDFELMPKDCEAIDLLDQKKRYFKYSFKTSHSKPHPELPF